MPSAKEMSKAQPMSISQLCQQDYPSDDEHHAVKQDLDQDPLDLNSEDHPEPPYMNGRNGYTHHSRYNTNGPHHGHDLYNPDPEQDLHPFTNHQRHIHPPQPDHAERMAAEVLGDMANAPHPATPSSSSSSASSFMAPAAPFISRMSSLPLVNSALKAYENGKQAYENGKQTSKVMK
ncbi:hypothetical protein BGX34_011523, partial [Mortierella sp. NVP85]